MPADQNAVGSAPTDIATPAVSSGFPGSLLSSQWLQETAAHAGAALAAAWGRPFRVGTKVIVARHEHVTEALQRDLDFLIAPVNETRMDEVNGPFVLGMDRCATLVTERQGLYRALSQVDLESVRREAMARAAEIIASSRHELDIVGDFARPIAAGTAVSLFGIKGTNARTFEDVARAVFAHTFLNLSDDKVVKERALRAAKLMRQWFDAEIAKRRASRQFGEDMMGFLLRDSVDDAYVRRTLGGMLVGSIDTTASSVAKIVSVIGKDKYLAAGIAADAADAARMAGWCNEALRRWPHNPILLRRAAADTTLAGTAINRNDDVVLWTHAAMFDAEAFRNPRIMLPNRPVASYLHFGAGLHPCAGRAINAFQIPLLVGDLVRRGIDSVGPVEWAGPFPARLVVKFGR